MFEFRNFINNLFGSVRTLYNTELGVLFVAKDIAEILGYTRTNTMLKLIYKEDTLEINPQTLEFTGLRKNCATQFESNPNIKRMTLITEAGLYAAIFGSTKDTAKEFKKWICSEVLPSIRKNGGYIDGQETLEEKDKELLYKEIKILSELVDELKKNEAALDDCISVWEKLYDGVYRDYKSLVESGKKQDTVVESKEPECEYIVTTDGFVMPKWVLTY